MKRRAAKPTGIIGILALQGSFAEHASILQSLGATPKLIRSLADTKEVTACILPGGESTTLMQLLESTGLKKWLMDAASKGIPIYGTCAGMIVLANLGLIDIQIDRNAYGPQLYSFEENIKLDHFLLACRGEFPGIFIRAPRVIFTGKRARILAKHGQDPVLIQQNNILASSFHPELANNPKIHEYWLTAGNVLN